MSDIYLDYAAATPVDEEVLTAMKPFFSDQFYNPSALYTGARDVKVALEDARHSVAKSIGARPSEVTFTAGGTESANLAISGVLDKYPEGECIISAVEHDAVREPALKNGAQICPVDKKAKLDMVKLAEMLSDQTVLVSVMYANNEVGTVQPVKEIAELLSDIRQDRRKRSIDMPIYLHVDACQAPNYLDVSVSRLGVDLMTLNGGKIYGPKQSGVLFRRSGVSIQPQVLGGGQELGVRSGTENVAFAVGFAAALEKAVGQRGEQSRAMKDLTKSFVDRLQKDFDARLNGHPKLRLPNNIHVTFPGCDNERVLFSLDEQGVWAAAGSACSASKEDVSHVLTSMGIPEEDARSSVRFSLGKATTQDELEKTLEALQTALKA